VYWALTNPPVASGMEREGPFNSEVVPVVEARSGSGWRERLDFIRFMRKTMHSNKEERKAADVAERWRELSARPSTAAQKEVKNSEDVVPVMVEDAMTCIQPIM